MTATPNYLIGVLDPAGPDLFSRTVSTTFPQRVRAVEGRARPGGRLPRLDRQEPPVPVAGRDRRVQLQHGRRPGQRRADRAGLLQDRSQDVDLFGGQLGNFEGNLAGRFDGGCVDNPFRWCDNLDNNDPEVMTFMSRTFANMVVNMAFDTKIMSSSTAVGSSTTAGPKTSKHFVAR